MAKKPTRGTLTLSDLAIAKIAKIREKTEAASDSEVVRRAIRLYERLLKDSGGELPNANKSK